MSAKTKEQLVREFVRFHRENPRVYELFEQFTLEALAAGHTRFSADAILHRVRWETDVATVRAGWEPHAGRQLKINNNHAAFYARLFVMNHPAHAGFFQFRGTAK